MDAEPRLIRCDYLPVLVYTPIVLAQRRSYYQGLGLEVALESLTSGAEAIPNLLSGRLDVATCGPGPTFWQAVRQGHDVRIIAPLHAEHPPATTPLIVRASLFDSGEVDTVADLRGRPVASPSPGVPLYWLASALESGGLTFDDVELRSVPYTEVGTAFERGDVDAALLGEPLATALVERGIAARLASDFVDGLQATYLFTRQESLQERGEEITRFVAGYLRACQDLESGDQRRGWAAPDVVELVADFTGTPGYEVMELVHPQYEPQGRFQEGSLERIYEFFVAHHMIDPIPNFKPASLIEHSVTRDALAMLRDEVR